MEANDGLQSTQHVVATDRRMAQDACLGMPRGLVRSGGSLSACVVAGKSIALHDVVSLEVADGVLQDVC